MSLPRSCRRCKGVHASGVRCPAMGPPLAYLSGWQSLSKQVIVRDGGICWLCGGLGADTADHVIARANGGSDGMDNLRAAHRRCNSQKGSK